MDNVCGYKINIIDESYQDFLAQLGKADLILTPTRRLATRLNKDYAQSQQQVWQIDIISLNGWLERLWQEHQDHIDNPLLLRLNAWQNQLVWQEIIENSDQTPLLRKDQAAKLTQQAWSLLKEWCLAWEDISIDTVSQDIQVFLSWCAQYQQYCYDYQVCDAASILQYIKPKLSQKIYLIGFTDIKPAVLKILDSLRAQGSQIEVLEYREKNPKVYCAPQIDAQAELVQAALWAKDLLSQNPSAPIGVIIPDLALRFNEVDHIFSKILMPQTVLANHYHDQKIYNISSGNKLTDFPVISIVFELLKYNPDKMPVNSLSKILLSPFISGGVSEYMQRAKLDLEIKQQGQEYVDPPLKKQSGGDLHQENLPSFWAIHIKKYLQTWGWPGERVLNSLEYQVVQRFYELLNDYSMLDCVQKPLSYYSACNILLQQAQNVLFQGESENAPLQILGALEGEGLYFEALWVTGLHHENWPQACAPHPFLPIDLQREHLMPHASSEREYLFASHLTQRFTQQAKQVILSYPKQENDKVLMPSSLIKKYPVIASDRGLGNEPHHDDFLETWSESPVPLNSNHYIKGGVGLLQSQSACPFQAFARYRLKAQMLESAQTGLSYAQRGELVHTALEYFWKRAKNSEYLLRLSDGQLNQAIDQAIMHAINQLPIGLSTMHITLEKNRLFDLIANWLLLEKNRPQFTVIDTEKKLDITLSGINLRTRIDRVDQLSTGEMILIDYKTGKVNTPNWLDTRPTQVQLPLYAVSHPNTQGVVFAMVKANEHKWMDLMAEHTSEKLKLSWPELLQHWQQVLGALADEFYQGHAQVLPLEGDATCRYCDLALLCRVRSQ